MDEEPRGLREPPLNIKAEKLLLGAILVNNRAYERMSEFLRTEHFALVHHGRIFAAAAALIQKGQVADPVTLLRYFEQDETMAEIGGPAYLSELANSATTVINAGEYAYIVYDLYLKRELIGLGEGLVNRAYDGSADATAADLLRDYAADLGRLAGECPDALRASGNVEGMIEPITLDEQPVPDRRWAVDGWIPHGTVTMLSGDGGVGKSILVMQLLTCAATGKDWLGQRTEPCKAIGIFCEDTRDELHRRQDAINKHYSVGFADLENMQWCCRVGEESALMAWEGFDAPGVPTALFRQIHGWAKSFGAQLIVSDALHDFFAGDENRRPHARQFIQLLADLARGCDGTVVLTSHPSLTGRAKGTGESGSTAWNNAVRSRLYLTVPEDRDEENRDWRALQRKKGNYASAGGEIKLHWRNGVFVPPVAEGGFVGALDKANAEKVFLDILAKRDTENRPVSHKPKSGNYAPKEFAKHPDRHGYDWRTLERAMESLFSKGMIEVTTYGDRPSRQFEKITRNNGKDTE